MSDVTLSYKGSDILELSDSGSATLKTGGKYCEDDIAVEYVKPSGGGLIVTTTEFTNTEETRIVTHNANLTYGTDSFMMIAEPTAETLALIHADTSNTFYVLKLIIFSNFFDYDLTAYGKNRNAEFQRIYGSQSRGSIGIAASFAYTEPILNGTNSNQIQYSSALSGWIYPNSPYKITIIQGQVG